MTDKEFRLRKDRDTKPGVMEIPYHMSQEFEEKFPNLANGFKKGEIAIMSVGEECGKTQLNSKDEE